MAEPLFFDCLTDAQFWSLLDSGVLQAYLVPWEVYERLERITPAHGCYLFTWPTAMELPRLQEIVPSLTIPGPKSPGQDNGHTLQTRPTADRLRSEIEEFCARVRAETCAEGIRIHIISTHPHLELRAGPYLEPPAHDLTAMSMPELEAYLDALLHLDARNGECSAAQSAYDPVPTRRSHRRP